jgi:hypothetical protein
VQAKADIERDVKEERARAPAFPEGGGDMRKFMAGLILGLMLGGAAAAFAAEITLQSGYLANWSVIQNGEEVCRDPFVSTSARQIECD